MIPDLLKRGSLIPRLFLVEERASSPGLFSLSSHMRIEEMSLGMRLEEEVFSYVQSWWEDPL